MAFCYQVPADMEREMQNAKTKSGTLPPSSESDFLCHSEMKSREELRDWIFLRDVMWEENYKVFTSHAAVKPKAGKSSSTIKMQLKLPQFQLLGTTIISIFSPLVVLLMLASQRIESVMDFSGESSFDDDVPTKRGAAPTLIEMFILSWVSGKSPPAFHSCRDMCPEGSNEIINRAVTRLIWWNGILNPFELSIFISARSSNESNVIYETCLIYLGHIKQIDTIPIIGFRLTLNERREEEHPLSVKLEQFFSSFVFSIHASGYVCLFVLVSRSNCRTTQQLNNHKRIDMEWGEAALGCRITRVHSRYVECDRFYNKLIVRRNSGSPCCLVLPSECKSLVMLEINLSAAKQSRDNNALIDFSFRISSGAKGDGD